MCGRPVKCDDDGHRSPPSQPLEAPQVRIRNASVLLLLLLCEVYMGLIGGWLIRDCHSLNGFFHPHDTNVRKMGTDLRADDRVPLNSFGLRGPIRTCVRRRAHHVLGDSRLYGEGRHGRDFPELWTRPAQTERARSDCAMNCGRFPATASTKRSRRRANWCLRLRRVWR